MARFRIRADSPATSKARRAAAQAGHRRSIGIELSGPFFEKDPAKTIRGNIEAMMERFAQVGEAEARRRAFGAPRKSPGPSASAARIRGRTRSLKGKHWESTAVISADTEGLDKRQAVRVQAALAGRRDATADYTERRATGFLGTGGTKNVVVRSRNIGRTPGHEGTAKVFSATARGLRRLVLNVDLTEGL